MQLRKIPGFAVFAWTLLLVGCASQSNRTQVVEKNQDPQAMTGAERAATALDRNVVSTIQFEPGEQTLTPEATAELNRAILEAKQKGQLEQVDVAVWSDMEYPAQQSEKLPAQQVDMAQARGQSIQSYLGRMEPEARIQVHNMARQPSSFANFFHTQDATVKNKLSAMGVAADPSGQPVSERRSSALVFLKLKQ